MIIRNGLLNKHYVVPTRSGMIISKKQAFLVMKEKNWLCFHTWQILQKKITRIFKAFNIKVCTKPIETIKNILPTTKDFIDFKQRTGAIYQIPCKNYSGIHCTFDKLAAVLKPDVLNISEI